MTSLPNMDILENLIFFVLSKRGRLTGCKTRAGWKGWWKKKSRLARFFESFYFEKNAYFEKLHSASAGAKTTRGFPNNPGFWRGHCTPTTPVLIRNPKLQLSFFILKHKTSFFSTQWLCVRRVIIFTSIKLHKLKNCVERKNEVFWCCCCAKKSTFSFSTIFFPQTPTDLICFKCILSS